METSARPGMAGLPAEERQLGRAPRRLVKVDTEGLAQAASHVREYATWYLEDRAAAVKPISGAYRNVWLRPARGELRQRRDAEDPSA